MKTKWLESQQFRQWSLINELCNDDNQVISHDHMLMCLRCRFRSSNVEVNALRRTYTWIKWNNQNHPCKMMAYNSIGLRGMLWKERKSPTPAASETKQHFSRTSSRLSSGWDWRFFKSSLIQSKGSSSIIIFTLLPAPQPPPPHFTWLVARLQFSRLIGRQAGRSPRQLIMTRARLLASQSHPREFPRRHQI